MPAPQPESADVVMRRTVVDHIANGLSSGRPEVITAALSLLTELDLAGVPVGDEVNQALVTLPPAWRRR
ncbi:hypothetical protein ACGFZP_05305 [Kitasatospora sp. NPDC048239]|uniref:hypothetical protein n=1 Tax=Kitasatospora sp. NPDC048239 TaxID=3364046 RepID=UPI0037122DE6